MNTIPCYMCQSAESLHLITFHDDPYLTRLPDLPDKSVRYVACTHCGFVYQNPMLTQDELSVMYGGIYRKSMPDESFITKNTLFTDTRADWIEAHLDVAWPGEKSVLDVGCGAGVLLHSFRKRGWQVQGIEPTESYAAFGTQRFAIDIVPGFFSSESFPDSTFHLITLSQVLEHSLDPGMMLRDCRDKLDHDGRLYIGVPTLMRPQRPVHPNTLAGPHLWIFSLQTLTTLLHRTGFEIVATDCDFKGLLVLAKPSPRPAMRAHPEDSASRITMRFAQWMDESSLYYTNMAALRARWPDMGKRLDCDFAIGSHEIVHEGESFLNLRFPDKAGNPVTLYGPHYHTTVQEALDRCPLGSEGLILLFGFGLGYMAEAVLARMHKGHILIIYERDEVTFKLALENRDLAPLLSDRRVELAVGDALKRFEKLLGHYSAKYMLTNKVLTLRQAKSCQFDPTGYQEARERIAERLKVFRVNKITRMGLGPLMMKNALDNMHHIMTLPGVNRLKGLFQGVPAIVVSAGPSLQKNFSLLKDVKGRALVIACDTVLRLLMPNGIVPDFTVTADPQETSYRKFRDIPMEPDSFLVCHPNNYPDMVNTFAGGRFAMGSNISIYRWLASCWPEKGQLDLGSQSVAHMAFNLATLLGAEPIIFIGQDFCFYEDKKYAGHLSQGSPWERMKGKKKNRKPSEAKDLFGQSVHTETLFQSFKVLMEDLIAKSKVPCINATEGGLGLKDTEVMTLHDALGRYALTTPRNFSEPIRAVAQAETNIHFDRIQAKIAKARRHAEAIIRDSEKVLGDVRKSRRLLRRKGLDSNHYPKLSARMERRTSRIREKEQFLDMVGEYALALELYMSSQRVIDIDSLEDPYDRFKKQVDRAGIYYRALVRILKPFLQGIKTLQHRVEGIHRLRMSAVDTPSDHLQALRRHKKLGLYHEATAQGTSVLETHPSHTDAILLLAEMALIQHHPQRACAYLETLGQTGKRSVRLETLFDQARANAQAWEEKIRTAVAECSIPPPLDNGHFYYRLGRYDLAIDRYTKTIASAPSWEGYYHVAHAMIANHDREHAVSALEEAIALSPNQAVLYRDLGLIAGDNGQEEVAEQFWLHAVDCAPGDPSGYELLSGYYVRHGEFSKAIPVMERLVKLRPEDPELMTQLLSLYHRTITVAS